VANYQNSSKLELALPSIAGDSPVAADVKQLALSSLGRRSRPFFLEPDRTGGGEEKVNERLTRIEQKLDDLVRERDRRQR